METTSFCPLMFLVTNKDFVRAIIWCLGRFSNDIVLHKHMSVSLKKFTDIDILLHAAADMVVWVLHSFQLGGIA